MRFTLLGSVSAVDDSGADVALGGRQQLRLLASLLAAPGRALSTDALIEVLWPDSGPDDRHATTLRSYVFRLRNTLGQSSLATTDDGYRLVAHDGEVDVDRFEELARRSGATIDGAARLSVLDEALAVWRGAPYAGFADEPWCRSEVARLNELHLVVLERRAKAGLEAGQADQVVVDLERVVAENPLRERLLELLVIGLYRTRRQAEALRRVNSYRDWLRDETGLDPGVDLVELERRVLDRDPSLEVDGVPPRSAAGYVFHEVIGEGRFGTVYRAVHSAIGREVAVKAIRRELADDPAFIRRFEVEAQLVAGLEHPHIVPVFDFWREPGGAYLVFRLLRGGSAAQRLEIGGPMDLGLVTAIIEQIGGALTAAHAAGVVHRDVKPANILFDDNGAAFLADFGIAIGPGGANPLIGSELHQLGTGSPTHASPEQLGLGPVTSRSDIYALGQTVYELLTSHLLLAAPSLASIREVRPDLPGALDAVLRKATALDAAHRYATVAEFVASWHDVVSGDAQIGGPAEHIVARNPYKGLRAFGEADAADFHGADAQLARLRTEMRASKFVAVVGPSGSGKSSLVRAGLLPQLRADGAFVMTMVPGVHPFDELESAMLRIAVNPPTSLRSLLDEERGLVRAFKRITPDDADVVLVIDQFEELYTITASAVERDKFVGGLVELVTDPHARVTVVATLRADFYDRPLSHTGLGPAVRDHTVPLTPLSSVELDEAIRLPAMRVGVSVEPALVVQIVADVSAQPGSLPLLQFTLTELFDRRDGSGLTLAAYRSLGGISSALAEQAEAVYRRLDPAGQLAARRLFVRLVLLSDGVVETRRRAKVDELPNVPSNVVEAFGDRRLVTFDHDPATREPTVEIAHEALIGAWPRLQAWLDDDRDALRSLRSLSDGAQSWAAAGRDSDDLCRGARLAAALELVDARPEMLSEIERDYVGASRAEHEATADRQRRTTRRLQRLLAATVLGLVLSLIAGGVAAVQRSHARANEHQAKVLRDAAVVRTLVTSSEAAQSVNLPLSLLLAVEANRRSDEAASRAALFSSLLSNQPLQRFWWGSIGYAAAAVTSDGSRVVLGRFDGSIEQRSFDGELLAEPFRVTNSVGSATNPNMRIALAEGGARVAVSASDGSVTLWDVAKQRLISILVAPGGSSSSIPHDIVVGGDGRLYVSSDDGTIRAFDPVSGDADGVIAQIAGHPARLATNGTGDEIAVASNADATRTYTIVSLSGTVLAQGTLDLPDGAFAGWAMSPDGHTLAASTISGGVGVFDAVTGTRNGPIERSTVDSELGFLADNQLLVVQGRALVLDPATGTLVGGPYPTDAAVYGIDRTRGRAMLAGANASLIRFSDQGDPKAGRDLAVPGLYAVPDPSGQHLAVATFDGGAIIVDAASGKEVTPPLRTPATAPSPLPTVIQSLAFSPDGAQLAISGLTGTIDVFDATTGDLRRSLPVPVDPSPDPAIAASLGELTAKATGAIAWSPDGRTIAVGQASTVLLLDAASGALRAQSTGHSGGSPWFSPDSRQLLVTAFGGKATIRDASTGAMIVDQFSCGGVPASQGLWLPAQRIPLVGAYESATSGSVCEVDPATWHVTPLLSTSAVASPQISPDAKLYVGLNLVPFGTFVHDLPSGILLGKLPGLGLLSPDGRTVVSSRNGDLVSWDLDPAAWQRRACQAAGRNLSQVEWDQYFPGETYRPTCTARPATPLPPG